jgi:hypothetical protein
MSGAAPVKAGPASRSFRGGARGPACVGCGLASIESDQIEQDQIESDQIE